MSAKSQSKNEALTNKNSRVGVSRSVKQFLRPEISGVKERFLELYFEYLSRFNISDAPNFLFSPADVSLTPEEFKAKYNPATKAQIQTVINQDPILEIIYNNKELMTECGVTFEEMYNIASLKGGEKILNILKDNRKLITECGVTLDEMYNIASSRGGGKILNIISDNKDLMTKCKVPFEQIFKIASEDKGAEILGAITKNIELITEKPHVSFAEMLVVAREIDGPKKLGILSENKALMIECGVSFKEMSDVLKEDKGEEILATINSNRKLISECGVSFEAMKMVAKEGGAEILEFMNNNRTRLGVNRVNFNDMVDILKEEIKGQAGSLTQNHNKELIAKLQNVLHQSKFEEALHKAKLKPSLNEVKDFRMDQESSQKVGETLETLNDNKDLITVYGKSLEKIARNLQVKPGESKKSGIVNSKRGSTSKSEGSIEDVNDVAWLDDVIPSLETKRPKVIYHGTPVAYHQEVGYSPEPIKSHLDNFSLETGISGVLESTRSNRTRLGFKRANLKNRVDINDNVRSQTESNSEDLISKVQNALGKSNVEEALHDIKLKPSLEQLEGARKNLRLHLEKLLDGRKRILNTISNNKELITKCDVPFEQMYKIASENNGAAILGAISKNIELITEKPHAPFAQMLEVARENNGPKKLGIIHRNRELMTECHVEFKQMRDILKEDKGERTLDILSENRKLISECKVPFENVKEVAKLDEGREILGIISQNRIRLGVTERNFGDLVDIVKDHKEGQVRPQTLNYKKDLTENVENALGKTKFEEALHDIKLKPSLKKLEVGRKNLRPLLENASKDLQNKRSVNPALARSNSKSIVR